MIWRCAIGVLLTGLACAAGPVPAGEVPAPPPAAPLPRAHAHNDYEHPRPLLDALEHGFCSVEADIHLVDGELRVAHNRAQTRPGRTLEALYLEPLRARAAAHGGRVYPGGPTFWLLVDFKSDGPPTWRALLAVLERYRPWLTEFGPDAARTNAITVVLSGNVPRDLLAAEPRRLAAVDGRLDDLEASPSPLLVPWVSARWGGVFTWRGSGPMPEVERAQLRDWAARAHAQGRRLRFWGAPDFEPVWREQLDAGVDLINTDRLAALARFLRQAEPPAPATP